MDGHRRTGGRPGREAMELSSTLQDALNKHINAELSSAYLYLSMSAYCDSIDMPGFAHWFRAQHDEETSHAFKIFDFVNDRGGRVVLEAIQQPPSDFTSVLDATQRTLDHERKVTSMIHRLYEQSVEESDYPAQVLLQWFISEHLKLVGDDGAGLLMIDARLAERGSGDPTG